MEPQLSVPCPSCSKPAFLLQVSENVEQFGEVLLSTLSCPHCGLKLNDVWNTAFNEPVYFEAKVRSASDLKVKIVRSTSGTVEIPELGTTIEPGPLADGYISNMEGLLDRVRSVLATVPGKKSDQLKSKIDSMKEGKIPFTVIVKDPFGNSALIGNKVEKKKLSAKDAAKLKHFVFLAGH
ncbi:MAG: ZPR1 zinc finger domain-containing protein [Candidatus Diapherotrites archaeon]